MGEAPEKLLNLTPFLTTPHHRGNKGVMRIPSLAGGLFSVPMAYLLMRQYAIGTPEDPQKAIGYVVIVLYSCFVWAMIALFVKGTIRAFSGEKSTAKFHLFCSTAGLVIAAWIFWNIQSYEIRRQRLETAIEAEVLQQEAKDALARKDAMALKAIAGNPNTPSEILSRISDDDNLEILRELAKNPNSPPALLWELSKHQRYLIKIDVLQNPSLNKDILKAMLNDHDARVRKAAKDRIDGASDAVEASRSQKQALTSCGNSQGRT